jgi:PAS domain S-box-containing protein
MLAWQARAARPTVSLRLTEAAAAVHPVAPVKLALSGLSALAFASILPATLCALWAAVAVGLEVWGWFASRPPAQDRPVRRWGHALFLANFAAINLWWLVLAAFVWRSGAPQGEAMAMAVGMTLCAVSVLLFYNAAWVYLAAGAAPAIGALAVIAQADGRDWRQMYPLWIILGLSAIFCIGRALKTPSTQASERRINASLREFEIIAENVTDVITRTGVNGIREYISPGCLAVLGYRPDEMVGTRASQFIHPDDLPAIEASRARMIADPTLADSVTVRVSHKDGRWVSLQSSTKMILENGVAVGLIGVSRDVTQQVAAEAALMAAKAEAEQANRAKAEFLANVSHEIRTPMNGILSALHLLEREPISAEGRELMRHADDSGRMLSQLLNDVLDFSKIDAGQLDLAPEPMNVGQALEGVMALLAGQAGAKGIELRREVVGADLWIEADPVRVRQAIFNLVGNAVKFTATGHVTARLAVSPASDGRRHVRLEVEDTGIGMDAEAQSHLFERFRQAEGDAVRRFGGTGLGLSITQALVRMMGGEITFSSVEGQGSAFQMAFDAPAAEAVSATPAEDGLLQGVNILLVEDNATNRLMARTLLVRLGANVEEAEDGLLGFDAARRGAHDLILMDVQMPHMDGVEATRAIRDLEGAAAQVPIIGLTANVMVHQRAEYMAAGMNGVVAKPISPSALLTEIARVIAEDEGAEAPIAEAV